MKKIVAIILTLCLLMGLSTSTSAQELKNENGNEIILIREHPGIEPRINKDVTVRFSSLNSRVQVTSDNPIVNQSVTITCDAFSDNVNTVQIGYMWKTNGGGTIHWSDDLYEGDSYSFDAPGVVGGWFLYAKVTSGSVSSSNRGVVTFHVED